MLQVYKNKVVTAAAKKQVEIRKLELDWYSTNYWTLSQQGALLAGFIFGQITTPLPRETPYLLECAYLLITTLSMGMQLCVIVTTTFCCMWGPGLALRGPHGSQSVHLAVDNLRAEQSYVFFFFVIGLLTFYLSNLLLLWCYFEQWVAMVSCIILSVFFFLIVYYTILLTMQLRVNDETAVYGKIEALKAYENIGDLDAQCAFTNLSVEGDEYVEHVALPPHSNIPNYSRNASKISSQYPMHTAPVSDKHLSDTTSYVIGQEFVKTTDELERQGLYHSPSGASHPIVESLYHSPIASDRMSSNISVNKKELAGLQLQNQIYDNGNNSFSYASNATPQGFWQTLFDFFS